MGGHGGLNILPQKKWNVYNRDNRERVEKDIRLAKEKQERDEKKKLEGQSAARIAILKHKNKESKEKQIQESLTEDELKLMKQFNLKQQNIQYKQEQNINIDKKQHVHLFKEEEQKFEMEKQQKQKIENKSFFENKPFGPETGLGQFKDDKYQKPWYTQINNEQPTIRGMNILKNEEKLNEQNQLQKQIQLFKGNNLYIKLDINNQKQNKNSMNNVDNIQKQVKTRSRSRSRSDSQQKNNLKSSKKKQKKHKKEKKESKKDKKREDKEREEKQLKLQILREKRLEREKIERRREIDIVRTARVNNYN